MYIVTFALDSFENIELSQQLPLLHQKNGNFSIFVELALLHPLEFAKISASAALLLIHITYVHTYICAYVFALEICKLCG